MTRLLRAVFLIVCFLYAGRAFAQGGACPSGSPYTGTRCYFVAADGSDSNSGTSEAAPWAHAPGMPNCSGNCLTVKNSLVTGTGGNPSIGFIFKGGDTWHFGNSAATPYTGGTWDWRYWMGKSSNCDLTDNPTPDRSSCLYIGVDKGWYSGEAWSRPILTGDNPVVPGGIVSGSCTYPKIGGIGQMFVNEGSYVWFDNFELTGICGDATASSGNNYLAAWYLAINDAGCCAAVVANVYSNLYYHGGSHKAFSCTDVGGHPNGICQNDGGAFIDLGMMSTLDHSVCDGWDSDPRGVACLFGGGNMVFGNVFGNMAQIVTNNWHDWHDNLWFGYTGTGDGVSHGNEWEANTDAPGGDASGNKQPIIPFNVWYNNIQGSNTPSAQGAIKIQVCVNTTAADYMFNNIQYDQAGVGNTFNMSGGGFNCTPTGGHLYLFNNTFDAPGSGAGNCTANMTVSNNLEIVEGGSFFSSGACMKTNETVMNHATALSQGYMAKGRGTSGSNGNTTCANELTPCAPTSAGNSTVLAGTNLESYCTSLLGSSAPEIVRAGMACLNGTTSACSYNTTTHTVSCPGNSPAARPSSGTWDSGAYQFSNSGNKPVNNPVNNPVQPPSGLKATVSPS